jgi:MFS family permease
MLLVVPLCQILIDAYGWRVAYRILAVVSVAWVLPAGLYLLRDSVEGKHAGPSEVAEEVAVEIASLEPHHVPHPLPETRSMTLAEAMRTAPFWLMVAAFFFGSLCAQTLHVHQVAFFVDHGMAALVAASVVGVVGVSSIFGKTGGGWLADRIERESIFIVAMVIMVLSVGVIMLVGAAPTIWGAYVYAVLLGVGYSATASLIPAMVSDRFTGRHFGAIFGVGLFGGAAGSAVGPWVAGRFFDLTGSYAIPFAMAAACGVCAGVAVWIARTLRRRAHLLAAGGEAGLPSMRGLS